MVVRVKVEVRGAGGEVFQSGAVANAGYEAGEEPEIHIPPALARKLGFEPEEAPVYIYGAVGAEVNAMVLGHVLVRVIEENRASDWVKARAVAVEGESEALLSDKLIEALGIELLRPASGQWRFSGEEKVRRSVKAQYWS